MVPVSYDSLVSRDAVTNTNVSLLTAISSLSADGKHLYLMVINRDTAAHSETIQLKNFVPLPTAFVYAMRAQGLQDALSATTDYQTFSVAASANFSHTFAGYSITFMRFDR